MFGKYFNETVADAVRRASITGRRHYIGKWIDDDRPSSWSYCVSTKKNDVGANLGFVDSDGTGHLEVVMPVMPIETSGAGC